MSEHCLSKPGAWPDDPWGHEHPVIKVADKIFAFVGAVGVGVKGGANRDVADEWLQRYPDDASVMAYIGRSGWNTSSSAARSPTTSCSRRSTTPTGWWSASCRRSTARRAGTPRPEVASAAGQRRSSGRRRWGPRWSQWGWPGPWKRPGGRRSASALRSFFSIRRISSAMMSSRPNRNAPRQDVPSRTSRTGARETRGGWPASPTRARWPSRASTTKRNRPTASPTLLSQRRAAPLRARSCVRVELDDAVQSAPGRR